MLEDKTDKKKHKLYRILIIAFCSLSIPITIIFFGLIGYRLWQCNAWGGNCNPSLNELYDTRGFAVALQEKLTESQRDEYFVFFPDDADMQNAECYIWSLRKEEGCEVNPYFDSYGAYLSLGDNDINATKMDFHVDYFQNPDEYIDTYELDLVSCKLYYFKVRSQETFAWNGVVYQLSFTIGQHSYWLNIRCTIDKDNPHEFVGAEDAYAIDLAPSVLEYAENIIKRRLTLNEFIENIDTKLICN